MAGSIGVGPRGGAAASDPVAVGLAEATEENRRLRAELEALKRAAVVPHPPAAPPNGDSSPLALRNAQRFHEEGLRSEEFQTARGKAAKEAINDDVTHEFFSAHERNTALNVQRDIRQSNKIAEDRKRKLHDAGGILHHALRGVEDSGASTHGTLRRQFDQFRETLSLREEQFHDDLERHRRGEVMKIKKEQNIVKQLLTTLDNLVVEAQDVMTGPKDDGGDHATDVSDYKTLAEIKDEFTELRQVLLPWDVGYLFDKITAKASEQMIDIRTTAVHDIIHGLIDTLSAARDKAEATFETLNKFQREVERIVPDTMERVHTEFEHFRATTTEKQRLFEEKVHNYKQNYGQRVRTEQEFVNEWVDRLSRHQQAAHEAVQAGNDHLLLQKLESLNQALVQIDGSTLTLGYDRIGFSPCRNLLSCSLDQLGVLQREEMECKPLFGNHFHYYHFLEHKEYMYGGSESTEGGLQRADGAGGLGGREKEMFTAAFRKIDRDGSGSLDAAELEELWGEVFKRVARDSVKAITRRIFAEIDANGNGRIAFSEFLDYLSDGMQTNLSAQRDLFYRPPADGADSSPARASPQHRTDTDQR